MNTPTAHLRNRALLAAIIDRIETDTAALGRLEASEEPFTSWYQGYWREHITRNGRCGTNLCAAGYAIELTGGTWLTTRTTEGTFLAGRLLPDYQSSWWAEYVLADDTDPEDEITVIDGNRVVKAEDRAMRLLGLERSWDGFDADDEHDIELHPLFRGHNTLDDLRGWLDRLPA
ncbi:hypothetical protein [Nonomuraea wenchangensis]|uniref:Uncharacterized protein n=1 Tax=Nonomuraea wenchangensis TaxID=568860 RepID=A0A1I0LTZ5_9ACTN|nr:hypothetical protein [Nonomuraea wenchangensis]SEU46813.1 hypothetical protein SAMN05421811_127149 [Nonomuraea wenchangensis]